MWMQLHRGRRDRWIGKPQEKCTVLDIYATQCPLILLRLLHLHLIQIFPCDVRLHKIWRRGAYGGILGRHLPGTLTYARCRFGSIWYSISALVIQRSSPRSSFAPAKLPSSQVRASDCYCQVDCSGGFILFRSSIMRSSEGAFVHVCVCACVHVCVGVSPR